MSALQFLILCTLTSVLFAAGAILYWVLAVGA